MSPLPMSASPPEDPGASCGIPGFRVPSSQDGDRRMSRLAAPPSPADVPEAEAHAPFVRTFGPRTRRVQRHGHAVQVGQPQEMAQERDVVVAFGPYALE